MFFCELVRRIIWLNEQPDDCGKTISAQQNLMACMSETSPVYAVIWSVWLVSCNQTNQIDRTGQMNKTGWRTFSASC